MVTCLPLVKGQPLLDPQWPGADLWGHGAHIADGNRISEGVTLRPAHQVKVNTWQVLRYWGLSAPLLCVGGWHLQGKWLKGPRRGRWVEPQCLWLSPGCGGRYTFWALSKTEEGAMPGSALPCLASAPQLEAAASGWGYLLQRLTGVLLATLASRASEGSVEPLGRLRVVIQRWVCDDQAWLCCPQGLQLLH